MCFEAITIEKLGDFWIAAPHPRSDTILFEPSTVPYLVRPIHRYAYCRWVDAIVRYEVRWIVETCLELFSDQLARGSSANASWTAVDPNYAAGLSVFLDVFEFINPPGKTGANKGGGHKR